MRKKKKKKKALDVSVHSSHLLTYLLSSTHTHTHTCTISDSLQRNDREKKTHHTDGKSKPSRNVLIFVWVQIEA